MISKSRGGVFRIVNVGQVEKFTGSLSNGILSENAGTNNGVLLVQCSIAELFIDEE